MFKGIFLKIITFFFLFLISFFMPFFSTILLFTSLSRKKFDIALLFYVWLISIIKHTQIKKKIKEIKW